MPTPSNTKVALIVRARDTIYGAADTQWILENLPKARELKQQDGIVRPDDLADN